MDNNTTQFDFDKDLVSCQSVHITLSPGDKVLRVRHGSHGSRFFEKAVVKKVTPKRVTVDIRLKGHVTGDVQWKPVSVDRWYLVRHNWKEAVSAPAAIALHAELAAMHADADALERQTAKRWAGNVEDERIGAELCEAPWKW